MNMLIKCLVGFAAFLYCRGWELQHPAGSLTKECWWYIALVGAAYCYDGYRAAMKSEEQRKAQQADEPARKAGE